MSTDLFKEDDPADPRTWDEARRAYGESDSEDEADHVAMLKEMMVRRFSPDSSLWRCLTVSTGGKSH
jgi:hypothetical protein